MRQWIVAGLAASALAGCATGINGFDERVQFASNPAGAQVRVTRLSDEDMERTRVEGRCETPCSVVLTRGPTYRVRFSKEGCGPVNVRLYPNYKSMLYVAWIPDFITGGAYDIAPNPVDVKMTCGMSTEGGSPAS